VPATKIEGIDIEAYSPHRLYSAEQRAQFVKYVKGGRLAWLEQFPGLEPPILASAQ